MSTKLDALEKKYGREFQRCLSGHPHADGASGGSTPPTHRLQGEREY